MYVRQLTLNKVLLIGCARFFDKKNTSRDKLFLKYIINLGLSPVKQLRNAQNFYKITLESTLQIDWIYYLIKAFLFRVIQNYFPD